MGPTVLKAGSSRIYKSPRRFLAAIKPVGNGPVVVCAGDSITRGVASANYLRGLRDVFAWESIAFVNAGVNGDLAWNVLQRLDEIIDCQPDVVTLLVGGNDVNATLRAGNSRLYRWFKRLPQHPTIEWYAHCVNATLERLQRETDARLVVLEISFIGEDLSSEFNQRVAEYNKQLRLIADRRGVPCLPLYQRLADLLPAGHRPVPYTGRMLSEPMLMMLRRRLPGLRRHDGDELVMLTDQIHLSGRAGAVVTQLIAEFIRPTLVARGR